MFDESDFIYAYTRTEALADGVLVDVSNLAQEAGFGIPAAITDQFSNCLKPKEHEKSQGASLSNPLNLTRIRSIS